MTLTCTAARPAKLLSLLRRELRLSSSLIGRLKYRGAFLVNGVPVHTDFPVFPGDTISVLLEEETPDYPLEEGPLSILYEDEALLAVDKPPFLMVHPSSARNRGTLANYVAYYYAKTGQRCAFHPVSRLDRDTFGVVLLAKNAHVHALLCDAHARGLLEKTYLAAVYGGPPAEEGVVDAPIAREDPMRMRRCVRMDGKEARTEYAVVRREAETSLVLLRPLTGRTHQLRIHLSYLGCPILGDPQYGTEESQGFSLSRGLTFQQLCAAALALPHPLTGEPLLFRSHQPVKYCFP